MKHEIKKENFPEWKSWYYNFFMGDATNKWTIHNYLMFLNGQLAEKEWKISEFNGEPIVITGGTSSLCRELTREESGYYDYAPYWEELGVRTKIYEFPDNWFSIYFLFEKAIRGDIKYQISIYNGTSSSNDLVNILNDIIKKESCLYSDIITEIKKLHEKIDLANTQLQDMHFPKPDNKQKL